MDMKQTLLKEGRGGKGGGSQGQGRNVTLGADWHEQILPGRPQWREGGGGRWGREKKTEMNKDVFLWIVPLHLINFPFIVDNLKGQFTSSLIDDSIFLIQGTVPEFHRQEGLRPVLCPHWLWPETGIFKRKKAGLHNTCVVSSECWQDNLTQKDHINTIAPAKISTVALSSSDQITATAPPLCWNLPIFSCFCSIWNNFTDIAFHHGRSLHIATPRIT